MICYYLVQYSPTPPHPLPSFLLTWGMGVFQHLFVNFLHPHVFEMNVFENILLLHVDVLQFYNYVHVLGAGTSMLLLMVGWCIRVV